MGTREGLVQRHEEPRPAPGGEGPYHGLGTVRLRKRAPGLLPVPCPSQPAGEDPAHSGFLLLVIQK